MVRQWFSVSAVLAVSALLVAGDASQARERRLLRRFRGDSDNVVMAGSPTESYWVVRERRFGRRGRVYAETYVTEGTQTGVRRAMYLAPESTTAPSPVLLDVRAPADTEILFDGAKTVQKGTLRRFISPPINPGHEYTYEILAKWKENGQERSQTRKVDVRAGQTLMVDLTKPAEENAKTRR
jgi:uncharacterized protein (TIGR03000 family)